MLIDPKQVELSVYSKLGSAYLATPVITEAEEAERVLESLCELMEERYDLISSAGKRNIKEYNALTIVEPMPYIVVVIDEYGDLVMQSGKQMERSICRLAQKARAVGIHLIISTQRPSATIVTGNIKANFPTRIAFRTTTGTDSRVILDQIGAEKLTGCGDMLYFAGAETTRVQCAYASIEEVSKSCAEIGESNADFSSTFQLPVFEEKDSFDEHRRKIIEEAEAKERAFWDKSLKEEREREAYRKRQAAIEPCPETKERRAAMRRYFYGENSAYISVFFTKKK